MADSHRAWQSVLGKAKSTIRMWFIKAFGIGRSLRRDLVLQLTHSAVQHYSQICLKCWSPNFGLLRNNVSFLNFYG